MNQRLTIVFLLGFSSGLPLALVTSTLQAWFADSGMSILSTGMLSLIGLPYLYRMFWGPLLDYYPISALGRRRSWMLLMQVLLFIGFNIIAWFSPNQSPNLIAALALVLAFFSATQDIAIDAHRIEYLPIKVHGLGASLAVFGYRLAMLIAGGVALIIAQHYGWRITYQIMSLFMLPGLLAALFSREPQHTYSVPLNFRKIFTDPIQDLLKRKHIISLVLFILFYKLGEAFTATTSGIVMPFLIQGIGFSLDTIGYINKLLGIGAILAGGLIAGLLLIRWSLYRALFVFGLLQAVTNILFIILAIVGKNLLVFALAVVCDNLAAGMGSTALVAFFMRLVNQKFTATQFSILVALSSLPRVFSGPLAALLQMQLGWIGLYQLSFLLALAFIPFLIRIKMDTHVGSKDVLTELSSNI